MQNEDNNEKRPLKPWVLPLLLGSVGVIVLGVISTYANTSVGAMIVLIGLIGFCWAAWGASRSAD